MHTIAYITDIHLDEDFPQSLGVNARKNWKFILYDIMDRHVDQVVFGGDIGTPKSNELFFTSLERLNKDLCIILGNHDKYADAIEYYAPGLAGNELYYTRAGEWYNFIFLDSSSGSISDEQLEWLKKERQGAQKEVILFIHHPVLGVDTPIDRMYPLKNRDAVAEILQGHKHNVTIFCGHYHMDDEQTRGNIKQYIIPAASYQIIKEADKLETSTDVFGYLLIHVEQDVMTTEFISFHIRYHEIG